MTTFAFKSGKMISVKAHFGDWKTLLAFNLLDEGDRRNLAGFTVQCKAPSGDAFYLHNSLRFEEPGRHAQDHSQPDNASINAPLHTFRWLHVPGEVNEDILPVAGVYTYTVTPRHFDDKECLLPMDVSLSVSLDVPVGPLVNGHLELGFTRGATQSQGFDHHFGMKALMRPPGDELMFDTKVVSGSNASGKTYTFAEQYGWLGFTARMQVFRLLREALSHPSYRLDVFAYDLNEPDVLEIVLQLAEQGRVRLMLDDAALHHGASGTTAEDRFEKLFLAAAAKAPQKAGSPGAAIQRGKFGRYAHDKIFILHDETAPVRVLTGSTNFSITGMYVNSNHVLVFSDPQVCNEYAQVFESVWKSDASKSDFVKSEFAAKKFEFGSAQLPRIEVTFSPHPPDVAQRFLQEIADRVAVERERGAADGSVLFAVMEMGAGSSPVYDALNKLHESQAVFSYGVSDNPSGTSLYRPGQRTGVLVSGKPGQKVLPPPFDQVRDLGLGHQIHHKFVVCGFNRDDAVVYCGSSNLAAGGEAANGDNLLTIHDSAVATAFAIEAVALVDHFDFLDGVAKASAAKPAAAAALTATSHAHAAQPAAAAVPTTTTNRAHAAHAAGWHLGTTDAWCKKFFDPADLRCVDRKLFA